MNKNYWKLTDDEYEYIKNEVIHIFVKYKIKCIPVSGFEIASKMKITLIAYSGLSKEKLAAAMRASEDGFYYEDNGKEYIFFNDIGRSYERQNMTILHEIAHCVLDHTGHSQHEEDEANFFAKYVIAPPVLIDKIGARSPDEICYYFNISYQAAIYAFEYYCKWKRRYNRLRKYTEYEQLLLNLYQKSA
ncbi:MAG: ImmA/IrrE family metallo-endopeptidase [Clostridiales bacterium]|nr:ImmA/IrrE family metallo-endopeptidase [Clostridiales bacterium]